MGEGKRKREMSINEVAQAIGVETMGGRIQVKWDTSSSATPFGQMTFFIDFLNLTGLYERWIEDCPLRYAGPNGSPTADILGTWFLSILSGHRRYAHITTLRADGVLPELLGMNHVLDHSNRFAVAEAARKLHDVALLARSTQTHQETLARIKQVIER
jgi:hypothetical protein